jgi:hypothetical protein
LHRTASAIIEAQEFNASVALILVHAFEKTKEKYNESFQTYCRFLSLFDKESEENNIVHLTMLERVNLYAGWVKGNDQYLEK